MKAVSGIRVFLFVAVLCDSGEMRERYEDR